MSLKRILKKLILEKLGYVEEDLIKSLYDTDVDKPRVPIISPNDTSNLTPKVPIVSSNQSNLIDLTKPLEGGFCEFNPQINQFAQSGPDEFAEMIIFVIATILKRWYEVVPAFPVLMKTIKEKGTLIDKSDPDFYDKNIRANHFAHLVLSKLPSIDKVWQERQQIYSRIKPLIDKYNRSNGIAKEEAIFDIYLAFLHVPYLGIAKAAFATQLAIGRLGCIDSVNMNLYKDLDKSGKLITVNAKGHSTFQGISKSTPKKTNILTVSPDGIELAKSYVEFLKVIAKQTKSGEAGVSRFLWDSWTTLIEAKMNAPKGTKSIDVIMPSGEKISVPNDYTDDTKSEINPLTTGFRKQYSGNITAKDISRQHHPRMMTEGFKKWTKYFYKTLNN